VSWCHTTSQLDLGDLSKRVARQGLAHIPTSGWISNPGSPSPTPAPSLKSDSSPNTRISGEAPSLAPSSSAPASACAAAYSSPTTPCWLLHRSRQWRQESLRLCNRETCCLLLYLVRHPLRKRNATRPMSAAWRVLVPRLGQLRFLKPRCEPHKGRPQTSMDISDLAADELAHEDVGTLRHSLRHAKDFMTLGMPPPATSNRATRNSLGKTRRRPACGLKHNAVAFDEGQSLFRRHVSFCSPFPSFAEHRLSSTDRRNGPAEHFGWFHPIQGWSRAVVGLLRRALFYITAGDDAVWPSLYSW